MKVGAGSLEFNPDLSWGGKVTTFFPGKLLIDCVDDFDDGDCVYSGGWVAIDMDWEETDDAVSPLVDVTVSAKVDGDDGDTLTHHIHISVDDAKELAAQLLQACKVHDATDDEIYAERRNVEARRLGELNDFLQEKTMVVKPQELMARLETERNDDVAQSIKRVDDVLNRDFKGGALSIAGECLGETRHVRDVVANKYRNAGWLIFETDDQREGHYFTFRVA